MRQIKILDISYTIRNENLNRYISEVCQHDMLDPEDEFDIALKAQSGDAESINRLVKANLRFVISVAKMYAGGNPERLSDLINEGNIGLVEAAESFDPTTGFKFISYAVWHIRKNMTKFLSEHSRTVRLPQNKITALKQMREIESNLTNELDRVPTSDEVIEKYLDESPSMKDISKLEKTAAGIKVALESNSRNVSLLGESKEDGEHDHKPINYINGADSETDSLVEEDTKLKTLNFLISKLNSREQEIITLRFGIFGRDIESRETLSKRFKVNIETIRNWENKIIKKLSILSKGMSLGDFLNIIIIVSYTSMVLPSVMHL